MGLFDTNRSHSDNERPRVSSSHHRGSSPSGGQGYFSRPSAGSASSARGSNGNRSSSIFGAAATGSSRGIFSAGGGGGSGSSYYKRRPRDGYVAMLMHKLQRMIKELWSYARRHPVKAFFAVVVPLLSAGGAVSGLMKQFGVRIPGMGALGGVGRSSSSSSSTYYDSRGYGGGSSGGGGGTGGWMNSAGSLMQVAKAFM